MSEVKVNSNVEEEWLWLVGNCNPADLGTWSTATPKDLAPGSEYQEGMAWMREPMDSWPCKKSFSLAREEEFRKDMMEGVCGILRGRRKQIETCVQLLSIRKEGIDRLIRVSGYVVAAVYKWRKTIGDRGPVIINPIKKRGQKMGYPSAECQRAGELYLLELAQIGMGISGEKMLATDVLSEEDILGQKRKLIMVGSWAVN